MSSNMTLKQGIYNPTLRYAFTNITNEDFTFTWNSSPITIKAGATVPLQQHLAILATGRLVDKIMSEEIKASEDKVRETTNNPFYRSPKASSIGIPAQREIWEKQICREMAVNEEDPQIQVLKAQWKQEVMSDLKAENSSTPPTMPASSMKEFEDVNLPHAN